MKLKLIVILAAALIICPILSAQTYDFNLVKAGFKYRNKTPGIYVVQTQADWKNLWSVSISEKDLVPATDFNTEILIAIFRPICPTAEYGVKIHKISFANRDLLVEIENSNPGDNCRRTMDSTKPFAIYSIKKTSKLIYFKESTILKNCN